MSIFKLPSLVDKLPDCKKVLWNRIYQYSALYGRLELVPDVRSQAKEMFGSDSEVEKQKIMRVTNLVTGEGALFNHLRGMRPQSYRYEQDLDSLVKEHRRGCPFCYPEGRTPRDSFGRIRGKYCLTAANLAKYDEYHGLVIPREHHPLIFNPDMVVDYFEVAARWFQEVQTYIAKGGSDDFPLYPFLMWNCLWPAGSSVVHGHLQMTVTRGDHYPKVEQLRKSSLHYTENYNSNYFRDLFTLHQALGLGWESGETRLLVSLTPIKEKEVFIILPPGPVTPQRLGPAGRAVCEVLNLLKEEAGLSSFNVAVYLPPLGEEAGMWNNFPLIARLVDRGSVLNRTADFGAMELFAASVISSDPFAVAGLLKGIKRRHPGSRSYP